MKVDIPVRLGDDKTLHVYQCGTAILVLDSGITLKISALYIRGLPSASTTAAQKREKRYMFDANFNEADFSCGP